MKRTGWLIACLLLLVWVTACATTPSSQEQQNAYYGPAPVNYEELIKIYFAQQAPDLNGAVYTFQPPVKGWMAWRPGIALDSEILYGWKVEGTVAAKTAAGASAGVQPFTVLIRDGQVIRALR